MPPSRKLKSDEGLEIEEISYSFSENLKRKLESLPKNFTVLVIVGSDNYNETVLGIVENLAAWQKLKGVYITANKQSGQLVDLFSKNIKGFEESTLYFLDCASKNGKGTVKNIAYCNPQNLIEINIQVSQALDTLPAESFIILDSISTLAIYNDEKVLKKFIKSVTEKCYSRKVKGIFLYGITKSNKEFIEDIASFFDDTIDAGKV